MSDATRSALQIESYGLDLQLDLPRSGVEARASLDVRNRGTQPLRELPLQISSGLRWQSATLVSATQRVSLPFEQHRLETDADHTGAATEAVLRLPEALAPGAMVHLDLFYGGTIAQSSGRLTRLGAGAQQGASSDWDAVGPEWTGLRGFGNVLWYPVASPQLFLADGNSLFKAIGQMKVQEQGASVALRLTLTYAGQAPVGVYFCGKHADLHSLSDTPEAPVALGQGVATAEFAPAPLGFRTPSLFVVREPEVLLGAAEATSRTAPGGASPAYSSSAQAGSETIRPLQDRVPALDSQEALVALSSPAPGAVAGLGPAAVRSGELLATWLGPRPLSLLSVLDHAGQPYQDGPLLVAPADTLETSPEQPAMTYSLAHAWVQTGQPWTDEGLAQFFALLTVEREKGREAAVDQLNGLLQPVTVVEPDLEPGADTDPGHPLITASDEMFYRRKAAAVWWMLRDLAGEAALRETLRAWREQPVRHDSPEKQALALEHLLEQRSGKDLRWFFSDWVLRDRGLPDLAIADVQVSQPPTNPGHPGGWLVAITVRNSGAAEVDVPVIVNAGQFSTGARLRVPGFGSATQRVLSEAQPTEVVVNDGSVPEQRAARHSRKLAQVVAP